ncbi:helix-turn-helix domain-containing protein [Maridesulfovibrio sp.]|uniref:helix-turn-helix domain-containing protein n=1 Tax=Maridesulfovibrio sp. TaxID=2795000 RepID=UPI0029CA224F|nr:helix-turn-helix domain-containing protein [Maridesulfovibrio sp.]
MSKIEIVSAENGVVVTGSGTHVFEMTPGKRADAVRRMLTQIASDLGSGLSVSVSVTDPSGEELPALDKRVLWLTPREVFEEYGVKEKTLQDWRGKGAGPSYSRIGGGIRYRREDLDSYFTENRVKTIEQG